MQWCFASVGKFFNNPVLVSRVLSFLIHILTAIGVFLLLRLLFKSSKWGIIGAWMFVFSPVMYYYAVNPLPDNLALCFSIFGLIFAVQYKTSLSVFDLMRSFVFLSLATLVKLPFIVSGGVLFYLILIQLRQNFKQTIVPVFISSLTLLAPCIWYLYSIPHWYGVGVTKGVFSGDFSFQESMDIILHNLISTIPELFINYAALPLFLVGFYFVLSGKSKSSLRNAFIFQGILVVLYFLLEHNMIGKVHDYYLFPFSILIVIITVYGVRRIDQQNVTFLKYIALTGILLMPLTSYLRSNSRWNQESPGFNITLYENHKHIRQILPHDAKCIVGEDDSRFIFLYYLDRKGWSFGKSGLSEENFIKWKKNGAQYLMADKPVFELDFIGPSLGKLLFHKRDLYIYQLK
jgi:hypothetical protein